VCIERFRICLTPRHRGDVEYIDIGAPRTVDHVDHDTA
jgi:hypothetical protein